jgi:hypothetical protein
MPRNHKIRKAESVRDDLAFPMAFGEQAKYLELADKFLALDQRHNGNGKVIPIDLDRRRFQKDRLKKAS